MVSTPAQASHLNLPLVAGLKKLVEDSLTHDWILRIEHIGPASGMAAHPHWTQWGDSLFAVRDASSVIDTVVACRSSHPTHAIRLNAEKVNPRTRMVYAVYDPEPGGQELQLAPAAEGLMTRLNTATSWLGNSAAAMRGLAWKVITVAGMLLASLLMIEEVFA